jgi:hypothetical protein
VAQDILIRRKGDVMQVNWKAVAGMIAAVTMGGLIAACQTTGGGGTQGVRDPRQAEAHNMQLVGHHDMQARSIYQPVIKQQGSRWIAYVGHHGGVNLNPLTGQKENNGTSIVDVTDPRNPRYLAHIPGDEGEGEAGAAQMVRICDGKILAKGDPAKRYLLRTFGNKGHEIWDVTVPEKPALVSTIIKGLKGTHKNWWECETGIAYLVSGVPEWRSARMTQVYDLSNPAKPVHIRDFGLPGQEPGTSGPVPTGLHGAISTGPKGNRIYFGYGTNNNGHLQIVDRKKLLEGPTEPNTKNLLYPQIARLDLGPFSGAHTTLPILGMEVGQFAKDAQGKKRDFVFIVNESLRNECTEEARQMVYVVDITNEATPFPVANFDVPEEKGNFCSRGGRFGAHSPNENQPPMYDKRLLFFTWFNAGLRAVDIRNPYQLKEVGYYIPAITDKTAQRCVKTAQDQRCKVEIQSNNAEVDDRGYIYVGDRANTGLHILELTGEARKIANFQ